MGIIDSIKGKLHHWGMIVLAILVAFSLGFVPMWIKAENNASERDAARAELRKAEISNLLSSAIVDARRGEYETARQEASEFFKRLTTEADKNNDGFLTADQRTRINTLFADRDDIITTLAQRDPASLDRLTAVYVEYRQTVSDAASPTN